MRRYGELPRSQYLHSLVEIRPKLLPQGCHKIDEYDKDAHVLANIK